MAIYEEIAELASHINTTLGTKIQPDTLVYLIESFIEDEDVPFTDVPIKEIREKVFSLILLSDAFLAAQDGADVETIEEEASVTAARLGVELE